MKRVPPKHGRKPLVDVLRDSATPENPLSGMESRLIAISEWTIGQWFTCGGRRWQVTDIGSRVVVAILETADRSWMSGPPYAVEETVFDENDLPGCELESEK